MRWLLRYSEADRVGSRDPGCRSELARRLCPVQRTSLTIKMDLIEEGPSVEMSAWGGAREGDP